MVIEKLIKILLNLVIFIFLWHHGAFMKLKARIFLRFFALVIIDMVPLVGFFPLNTVAVLLAWRHIRKELHRKEEISKRLKDDIRGGKIHPEVYEEEISEAMI